jgi:hypothetical protein
VDAFGQSYFLNVDPISGITGRGLTNGIVIGWAFLKHVSRRLVRKDLEMG